MHLEQRSDQPIELSDEELATIQGGGIFGWIKRNVVQPVIDYVTGEQDRVKPRVEYIDAGPGIRPGTVLARDDQFITIAR